MKRDKARGTRMKKADDRRAIEGDSAPEAIGRHLF